MESQTPQDLRGTLNQLEITIRYHIDFRVYPRNDGQPDFIEAANYLDQFAGIDSWKDASRFPHFDTHAINDKTYYTMPVIVSADALMLLKWYDLAKEELRVLFEKPVL
jgi:hypothetical protein